MKEFPDLELLALLAASQRQSFVWVFIQGNFSKTKIISKNERGLQLPILKSWTRPSPSQWEWGGPRGPQSSIPKQALSSSQISQVGETCVIVKEPHSYR